MGYNKLAAKEVVNKTIEALNKKNINVIYVETGDDALAKIKELIPKDASVMNGSSRTLEQIGYVDYLKSGKHGWNNLHETILAENDKVKQVLLRKQSVLSDFYLGSVHALTQSGELIIASNTGSQLPHIVYTSPNLIFVVSTKKIVSTFETGMERLKKHVVPLEDENMKQKYGTGTALNKIVIFIAENLKMGRKITLILVNEDLGF
jgi:L-lactate utilization protein LutC